MMSTINYDARATLHKWQSLESKRASDPPTFGITRGTHVLKALSVGAKACSGGRFYLYALAAAGQPGRSAAMRATIPVPHATSSARSPGRG
jgi:hypothetical protein